MGLFTDAKAAYNVKRIKNGYFARLSICRITHMIVNLPAAKQNLTSQQYYKVYELYNEMHMDNTEHLMDIKGYNNIVKMLIEKFEQVAPFNKYYGGETDEFLLIWKDIKNCARTNSNIQDVLIELVEDSVYCDNDYINTIVDSFCANISYEQAKAFCGILVIYIQSGKDEALKKFDMLINFWISNTEDIVGLWLSVSFLCGVLYPNEVVSKEESDALTKKYSDKFKGMYIEKRIN